MRAPLTLGVIGVSPAATLEFMARIQGYTPVKAPGDHIRVIADINPKVPDLDTPGSGAGPVLACDVTGEIAMTARDDRYGERPWWRLVWQGLKGNPGILSILMRSGTVGSEAQRRIVREQCDYLIEPPLPDIGMRDWRKFDQAIQEGYDAAHACIGKTPVPMVQTRVRARPV